MTPAADAIVVRDLVKRYPARPRLRSIWRGLQPDDPLALGGVSLKVPQGSGLGVIGRNGAGKSTLLRLIAGLARPSEGEVHVSGRVAALLELGSGLIDEWSGEANVRASLRLRGLPASGIDEALDFVREFSELGTRLDEAVRSYSSGMRLRLGYALAVVGAPEVLVVDEVLAVGDESFQRKCSLHVEAFLGGGGTLVLAAHNLYLVEKLCAQAVWLDVGAVRRLGASRAVTAAYRHELETAELVGPLLRTGTAGGVGVVLRVGSGADTKPASEIEMPEIAFEEAWWIEISGLAAGQRACLALERADGSRIAALPAEANGRFEITGEWLLPGTFVLRLAEDASPGAAVLAEQTFVVSGARRELGSVFLPHRWG